MLCVRNMLVLISCTLLTTSSSSGTSLLDCLILIPALGTSLWVLLWTLMLLEAVHISSLWKHTWVL